MANGRKTGGRAKGSRNKLTADIMAMAGKHTPAALKTLVTVMETSESDAARVTAAKELLDRGHGKAPQPQTGEGGKGPIELAISWLQPSA